MTLPSALVFARRGGSARRALLAAARCRLRPSCERRAGAAVELLARDRADDTPYDAAIRADDVLHVEPDEEHAALVPALRRAP